MVTRREAALRLDIPQEMAVRHGIPTRMSEAELEQLDTNPPAWLIQSRANRTGKRPVWVQLTCDVCGYSESVRPKKWWGTWPSLSCDFHRADDPPLPADGMNRREVDGLGSRFI